MTSVDVALDPTGALVEIEVAPPYTVTHALLSAGRSVPPPVTILALIDTGADVTTLDPTVLTPYAAVGLAPSRLIHVNAPGLGGLALVPEYEITLTLGRVAGRPRSGWTLRRQAVVERSLGSGVGFQALLGRDVLDRLAFLYDGPGRRLTLLLG